MKLLLDTHILLWFITDSPRLSSTVDNLIQDPANDKSVSIVSLWEIAIKVSTNKLTLAAPFDDLFPHQLHINGFDLLPISIAHTSRVSALPFHHRDPFDRLLVAQTVEEDLSLVSVDDVFDTYGITRLS